MNATNEALTNESWIERLNELFKSVGARCAVAFRIEDNQTWGTLTLSDEKGPVSVNDWPVPFFANEVSPRFGAFAAAAAENLRSSADRVGSDLTMEDVLDPAIFEQAELETQEQFLAAFSQAWATADWIWA